MHRELAYIMFGSSSPVERCLAVKCCSVHACLRNVTKQSGVVADRHCLTSVDICASDSPGPLPYM